MIAFPDNPTKLCYHNPKSYILQFLNSYTRHDSSNPTLDPELKTRTSGSNCTQRLSRQVSKRIGGVYCRFGVMLRTRMVLKVYMVKGL